MRRSVLALVLALTACRNGGGGGSTAPTPVPASRPAAAVGATGPREAAAAFLASIKAEDVQATSISWGSAKGPARELIRDRTELEKRILIMQCQLSHDSYRVVSDLPAAQGKRNLRVELRKGQLAATTTMTVVQGPNARWFVENTDLAPMRGFCSSQSTEPKR